MTLADLDQPTCLLNDGRTIPLIGYGTYLTTDPDECVAGVLSALEAGYRHIDTAEGYGNKSLIGRALAGSSVVREDYFLTTKVSPRSFEDARSHVLASRDRLGVDYLDLVLLHWPFANYYKAWRDLEAFQREGVVRSIGVSNFEPSQLIDLIEFNEVVPAVNQVEMNVICQRVAERGWMERYDVVPGAWAPLGQWYRREVIGNSTVADVARAHDATPAQVALSYLLEQGVVVLPKSVTPSRIEENLAAASPPPRCA
ncbi:MULTISPECIES: aldo/keto reductase [unclassified Actinomyces]|uniref:aldo/keto reductase n=1 Tax=unclassified Actinomyces TaxID=2609248 RepID=UPI0020178951|nr:MULTISPECIES: aldo/keto reductase [unclassified Actinomyces]MCL3777647.1 aldo/keto reductase [Actinomyces sp. AC-20-1]MCL3790030.1 aldo/keto reductase [Actinomyces sp. 187325]MCL3792427.1 aldo/keto reductase [Actinomyces sp. 186855]MCL3794828.1 aldo/keto reductase [Actinomyces sp. 217892]